MPEASQVVGCQLCDFWSLFLLASGTADQGRASQAEKEQLVATPGGLGIGEEELGR